jgi:hypothetical protein
MTATIQTILLLLAVLVVVAIVARRLNTAPSILLVIAGIGLALAPGLPRIELAPELVLLGILPPLSYSAGFAMSWRDRANKRTRRLSITRTRADGDAGLRHRRKRKNGHAARQQPASMGCVKAQSLNCDRARSSRAVGQSVS